MSSQTKSHVVMSWQKLTHKAIKRLLEEIESARTHPEDGEYLTKIEELARPALKHRKHIALG